MFCFQDFCLELWLSTVAARQNHLAASETRGTQTLPSTIKSGSLGQGLKPSQTHFVEGYQVILIQNED